MSDRMAVRWSFRVFSTRVEWSFWHWTEDGQKTFCGSIIPRDGRLTQSQEAACCDCQNCLADKGRNVARWIKRFMRKVEKLPSGCWYWTGCKDAAGYGNLAFSRISTKAHRFSFQYIGGRDIREDQEIHHICENKSCVNPEHLQAVTRKEHVDITAVPRRSRTYCKHGHEFTEANTYYQKKKNWTFRRCRACNAIACQKYHDRKRLELWQRKARMEAAQKLLDGALEVVA